MNKLVVILIAIGMLSMAVGCAEYESWQDAVQANEGFICPITDVIPEKEFAQAESLLDNPEYAAIIDQVKAVMREFVDEDIPTNEMIQEIHKVCYDS